MVTQTINTLEGKDLGPDNNMDPLKSSSEQKEQDFQLTQKLKDIIPIELEQVLKIDDFISKIRGLFLKNWGDFDSALKNTIKDLNLWDNEKTELQTLIQTSMKKEDNEIQKDNEKEDNSDNWNNKYEETKEYTIFERFKNEWKINNEEFKSISESLKNWKKIDDILILISDNDIKKEIEWIIKWFDNETNKNLNCNNFESDFKEISWNKIDLKEDNVMKLIWENYIKLPDINWKFNLDEDFSNAIKLASAEIHEISPNMKKDSEEYKKAIQNINSWNHSLEYIWLKAIHKIWNQWDWIWKKLDNAAQNNIEWKKSAEKENTDKYERMKNLLELSAENWKNKHDSRKNKAKVINKLSTLAEKNPNFEKILNDPKTLEQLTQNPEKLDELDELLKNPTS